MRPYILAETNWKHLQHAQVDLAVLPWGATEAHNYHMPYGTDIIEADEIAARSAAIAWEKGARVIVLPTIPFGVNTGQTDIFLDINIYPSTQFKILDDVLEVLNRQGIRRFLILNSHGGNDFKTMLRELGVKYNEMLLTTCNWFASVDKDQFFEHEGDHADEMETSLLLRLRPELVLPLEEAGDGHAKKSKVAGIREKWAWAERSWSKVTADTGVGDPRKATREKGENYLNAVVEKVATLMTELAEVDPDNPYS